MNKVVKAENEKIVVPAGTELINVIGGMSGVLPIERYPAKPQHYKIVKD
jgi:hypothetical protein